MVSGFFSSFLVTAYSVYKVLFLIGPALAGVAVLFAAEAHRSEKEGTAIFWAILALPGIVALTLHFGWPPVAAWHAKSATVPSWPFWHLPAMGLLFAAGLGFAFWWLRVMVAKIDAIQKKVTKKTDLERDRKTDIRYIDQLLPPSIERFDPLKHLDLKKGVFVGLSKELKPIYMPADFFDESHVLLCGRTRSGKGVAAQVLGVQSVQSGELFVVLDPKKDAWMPHIFREHAKRAGVPWALLDLAQSAPPQVNPFDGASCEEIESLLLAAFSLAEKGEAADFYRVGDRRAALECARLVVQMRERLGRSPTPSEIMADEIAGRWHEDARNFWGMLLEMAELAPVNAVGGLSIDDLVKSGGCLYVLGDMQNSRIVRMQRLILLRLMQIARARPAGTGRLIRVFADEFTVHISKPFLVGLAAAAGWRLSVILAFQTLGDLADCPSDLDKEAVKAKVWENCAVKLLYAIRDAETAEWLAKSTGTIQVDIESRQVEKNLALAETVENGRTLRQDESYLVDVNMLLGMPKGCGVLFGAARLPAFCYTSPVAVDRDDATWTPTHPGAAPRSRAGAALTAASTAALLVALPDDQETAPASAETAAPVVPEAAPTAAALVQVDPIDPDSEELPWN